MSAPIASQAMHFRLQVVQMSCIYYLVTELSYSSLQPSGGCAKRKVALLRRILLVMSVAALMVAMMVASAMPAFAFEDKPTKSQGNEVGQRESGFTANGTGAEGSTSSIATQYGQYVGNFFSTLARS